MKYKQVTELSNKRIVEVLRKSRIDSFQSANVLTAPPKARGFSYLCLHKSMFSLTEMSVTRETDKDEVQTSDGFV
jgi:hypothetical protein